MVVESYVSRITAKGDREMQTYPIAKNGVFWTIQGEGHLRGFQMCFVRLAGCSVGCKQCDTDYSVNERLSAAEIAKRCHDVTPRNARDRWVWITGGEPTDHDLRELLGALRSMRFSTALATSGHRRMIPPVDWLSVSPHDPKKLLQTYGNEIKVVPGLGSIHDMKDFLDEHPDDQTDFMYRYVQPLWKNGAEDSQSLKSCLAFLNENPNWSLSRQDHKHWDVA